MEFLQTIWTSLITPNEGLNGILFNKFGIPFIFIEITVNMLLFTTIFDIKYNRNQYIIYLFCSFISGSIFNLLFDKPYCSYLFMIAYPIIIHFTFRINMLKSILTEIFLMFISSPIETIFARFYLMFFNAPYELVFNIPLFRLSITLTIYLVMFLIYILLKKLKYNIILSDTLSRNSKILISITSIVGLLTIATQIYLICFYNTTLPFRIIILSLVTFVAYFFVSIFSLLKTTKLEITSQNLQQAKDYNATLKLLYDDIRTFRHDFGNIVQSIGGYIHTDDISGLKEYYKQLQSDCENVKSLEVLNPTIIDNPAIYSLLTSKYHKATNLNIEMKIHVSLKLENLNMKIYDFTRVLGILLDNAIEACEKCDEKIINLEIRRDAKSPRQLLLVQNTYFDKNIDLDRIRQKGFTSKKCDGKSHGLGLWEVDKILRKSKNLSLYTTKDSLFFTQQLEIYDK